MNTLLLDASLDMRSHSIPQFLLLLGMLLVFYFFMIRPQQNRSKAHRAFLEKMKKGSRVVTIGGIHGKVYQMEAHTLVLEIDGKGTKITVERGAISWEATKQLHTSA